MYKVKTKIESNSIVMGSDKNNHTLIKHIQFFYAIVLHFNACNLSVHMFLLHSFRIRVSVGTWAIVTRFFS